MHHLQVAEKNGKDDAGTILIVDDTPQNLIILGELLQSSYHVRAVGSGADALRAAHSEPRPDLILLDIMMPQVDGYQVLQRLKSDPETSAVPVIFITAMNDPKEEEYGLALGAVDYIVKPFNASIVLARVRTHIELKKARDRMRDQNAWLEAEVSRRMDQNQMIQDVSLRALASLVEARDNETGNHILRTKGYVQILAHALARLPKYQHILTPAYIAMVTKAAPLHDLGKIGIPDHILLKPGKHTPEEWEIMKTHAKIGADAIWRAVKNEVDLDGVDFLYKAMEIAGNHHEKWDGSGYPAGLCGEDIPLSARMMALADVFDALINKRIYKPAFSIDKATDIIVEGRGKHFDPDVVDAFLASRDEFVTVAQRYADKE